jgi:hypothetical protein
MNVVVPQPTIVAVTPAAHFAPSLVPITRIGGYGAAVTKVSIAVSFSYVRRLNAALTSTSETA